MTSNLPELMKITKRDFTEGSRTWSMPSTRRRILATLAAATTITTTAGCLSNSSPATLDGPPTDWGTKMATSDHQAQTSATLPGTSSEAIGPAWTTIDRRPVLAPDTVYLTTENSTPTGAGDFTGVVAISRSTGDTRWKHPLENAYTYPTVVGDTVFVQGKHLSALDRTTGDEYWAKKVPFASGRTAPTRLDDAILVTAAPTNSVRAFDARTGDRRWTTDALPGQPTDLAADTTRAYVTVRTDSTSGALLKIDPEAERVTADCALEQEPSELTVTDTHVVVTTDDHLYAIDKATLDVDWRTPLDLTLPDRAGLATDRDHVYAVGSRTPGDRRLYALDRGTGDVVWEGPRPAAVDSGPITVGDSSIHVPVHSENAAVLASIDPESGRITETRALIGTPATGASLDDGGAVLVTRVDGTPTLEQL